MLLLLSHFSRVQLCATPETAAHQAPPSLGISRQEHWSELPFPSPMHESEKGKWSHSAVSDSWQLHGLHPTGLLHPWIFQARVLEWGAIAFSMYMYTLLYLKWTTNKDLLHSTWNFARCYVAACMGGEFVGGWTHVYVWLNPFAVHPKL